MGTREEFVERYVRAIVDLPQDARVVFDLVDDPELGDDARVLACGALVSLLQSGDPIPDTFGAVGLLDDAVVLRLAAERVVPAGHPRRAAHAERHGEFYGALEADLAIAREFFGDCFVVFDQRLDRGPALEHKGKRAADLAADDRASTWLLEEVDEYMTELEIDEEEVATSMRKVDQAVAHLRRRMAQR